MLAEAIVNHFTIYVTQTFIVYALNYVNYFLLKLEKRESIFKIFIICDYISHCHNIEQRRVLKRQL